MSAINKGDLVLVTGANGYLASHIVSQLLSEGFRVRGTVRSQQKARWLLALFPGDLELVTVPDMVADGAFDAAVRGVAGVVHVASVMSFSDDPEQVIPQTVKGVTNALRAAAREPGVRAFVHTSSSSAAVTPVPGKEFAVEKWAWNELEVQRTRDAPTPPSVYSASKVAAEKAVWEFVEEEKPRFRVSAVLPNWNMGPILDPDGMTSSSSGSFTIRLWNGDEDVIDFLPPQWFVDVRDTAKIHVAALVHPDIDRERFFAFGEPFNWNDVLGIFRKLRPDKIFLEDRDLGRDLSSVPNESARLLLEKYYKQGWTSLEASTKANIGRLLDG